MFGKCVCVINLLKINFAIADIYLEVKDRHFGFSTEELLSKLCEKFQEGDYYYDCCYCGNLREKSIGFQRG